MAQAGIRQKTAVTPLRVVVVDNHEPLLNALRWFFHHQPELLLVGDTPSSADALGLIEQLQPDVVLVDVAMPEINGFELTRRIKQLPRAPLVIVMSVHEEDVYEQASIRYGADAFIDKANLGAQLLPLLWYLMHASYEREYRRKATATAEH